MKRASVLLMLACGCSALLAADPVPAALLDCERITEVAERARCFDHALAALKAAAAPAIPPASPPAAPRPASPAPAERSQSRFGQEHLPQARRQVDEEDAVLQTSIRSIEAVGPKQWLITLANGQVWRQEGMGITSFFEAGDAVRIEKAVMGNYRLSGERTGSKNWVGVTRVR